MDKEEFAKKMTGYDGLDRGGDIRTTVDEDGNVFMFSENQYGCPVIDVLVEGQDKMTLYYMTRPGTAKIDERTNRVYEPEDGEMALRYGRLFHNVSTTDKKAEDLMVLKIAKGIEVHDEGFVGGADSLTKSDRKRKGRMVECEDVPYRADKYVNTSLLKKAINAYNHPERFAENVNRIKKEREASNSHREAERKNDINYFIRTANSSERK